MDKKKKFVRAIPVSVRVWFRLQLAFSASVVDILQQYCMWLPSLTQVTIVSVTANSA